MEVEIDTQCGRGELVAGFWWDARGKGRIRTPTAVSGIY
jgi:hypothetical protein